MADRLLFSKTGRAKYISHLDLMRTFQRAFARAKIPIKHTEGFGLMEGTGREEVPGRLTAAMPEGIVVHQCYPAQRKLKELAYVNYIMNMEYPAGRPQETESAMRELLGRDSLIMQKKSNKAKKGYTEVDLIPLIRGWNLECQSDTMTLDAVLSAQNPGLNPELIHSAFCQEYPQFRPDMVTFHRREVLDKDGTPFR